MPDDVSGRSRDAGGFQDRGDSGRVFADRKRKMIMKRSRKSVVEKINDTVLGDLQTIPGVGPKTARDLYDLGIRRVSDLTSADPESLYQQLCEKGPSDRCMLYVFRCAVYFATRRKHEPELLKWWNWTDRKPPAR